MQTRGRVSLCRAFVLFVPLPLSPGGPIAVGLNQILDGPRPNRRQPQNPAAQAPGLT
jgi:hypothetical protein